MINMSDDCIIFFDLETTGTSITKDKIVQIAAVKTNLSLEILDTKCVYVNPEILIPKGASDVHGITDETVKDAFTFKQYSKAIFEFFNVSILAGFNIDGFDVPLLSEEFARCGIDFPTKEIKIIDSFQIFRDKEPRTLTAAVKFYTGQIFEDAHDALKDVIRTIEVLEGQRKMYGFTHEDCFLKNDKRLDLLGKIILNDDNIPVYSFGKAKGVPVISDRGFGEWMLKNDFPIQTKNILRALLYANK
jgi:DNA polymerase-3 subunit epsilon